MSVLREGFADRVRGALQDQQLQAALDFAIAHMTTKMEHALAELPNVAELKEQAQEIRRRTMQDLDEHLERLTETVTASGGVVHRAEDAEEACRQVVELARQRGVRLVVKSKSMTCEEIELNPALERAGIEVVETDLGEWIIQLARERPSHIVGPALHKTRHQVAELFSREVGEEVPAEIEVLTAVARRELRRRFISADMGISGVNFAVAESGTLVIVTNEGNGRLVTSLPPVHVAVMGMEKVVPTLEETFLLLKLLPRSATGQKVSGYVSFITGPRRFQEVDGPQELHLIILDNGRSRVRGGELGEALHCIRCGACLNICPVYGKIGGHAYGWVYSGPIGSVLTPLYCGTELARDLAHVSSLCRACLEVCPVRVDIPRMLLNLRGQVVAERKMPWLERTTFKLLNLVLTHHTLYRAVARLTSVLQRLFLRQGRISGLPFPLSRWTAYRDFPPLAAKPFWERWEEL
ncbi:MAG: LutB/LldF family L-lactate oxidation iron-sulfur protein [Anaerolineae bacterium]